MATWGTLTWSTGNFGAQNNSDTLVNGISASFNIGDVITISTVEFGWGRDTYGARAWGSPDQIVNPSGLSLTAIEGTIDPAPDVSLTGIGFTAALGNENAFTDVEFSLTGISISNILGNEDAFTDVDVSLTGFAITNSLGDETTAGEINTGWGRLTWGENAWSIAGDLEVTGNSATLALGNESISIDVAPEVTGIPMTSSLGDEFIEISFEIELTGLPFTSNLGTADAGPDAMLEGIGGTASVGSVEAYNLEGWGRYFYGQFEWGATGEWESVELTGIALSANVGTLAATGNAEITLDSSIQFTAEGNAQLSTAQQKFGSASLLLDGTNDFVDSTTNLDLSSGDFTIDVWIRPNSVSGYKGIWESGTSTKLVSYLLGNTVYLTVGGSTIISSSVTVNANEWTMLSYERVGDNHYVYKNGTLEDTGNTANRPDNGIFSIGESGFGDFNGYIDEFRVSDVARYSGSSFTEPTSEFTTDLNTTALLHFNGANGSTDIINSVPNNAFAMTANEGSVDPSPDAEVTGIGFASALAVGTVVAGDADVTVIGEGIAAGLGLGELDAVTIAAVNGISLSANLGSVTTFGNANVFPTGFGLTSELGTIKTIVWNQVDTGTAPVDPPGWVEVAA